MNSSPGVSWADLRTTPGLNGTRIQLALGPKTGPTTLGCQNGASGEYGPSMVQLFSGLKSKWVWLLMSLNILYQLTLAGFVQHSTLPLSLVNLHSVCTLPPSPPLTLPPSHFLTSLFSPPFFSQSLSPYFSSCAMTANEMLLACVLGTCTVLSFYHWFFAGGAGWREVEYLVLCLEVRGFI